MAAKNNIPIPYLRECFEYDPETGVIRWHERPRSHFPDDRMHRSWNTRFAGTTAGTPSKGYVQVRLLGHFIHAHRIIWALVTGEWPTDELDHRNGQRADNRLADNLRPATRAEQAQNTSLRKDNRSGLTGVWFYKRTGRWAAGIEISDNRHHLGYFDTKEEAHAAYLKAKSELHRFQPIPR